MRTIEWPSAYTSPRALPAEQHSAQATMTRWYSSNLRRLRPPNETAHLGICALRFFSQTGLTGKLTPITPVTFSRVQQNAASISREAGTFTPNPWELSLSSALRCSWLGISNATTVLWIDSLPWLRRCRCESSVRWMGPSTQIRVFKRFKLSRDGNQNMWRSSMSSIRGRSSRARGAPRL